jgi:hypothetical protein
LFFSSCKNQVEFLLDDEKKNKAEACIIKKVEGQDICVEQRVETFHIGNLHDRFVDFLFVLDVSPSMADDLVHLGQGFEDLISQVKGSKWQMAFTTADHGDHNYEEDLSTGKKIFPQQQWKDYQGDQPYFGHFMHLEYQGKKLPEMTLNPQISDYVNVFKDTVSRGVDEKCLLAPYCQGSLEQPLRVLNSSIERLAQAESDSPMLKNSEVLVSLIVTDEDERLEDQEHATTAQEVLNNFKKLFPEKSFHVFTLLIQDEQCLAQQKKHSPQSVYGEKISELAKITNGKNISLCEENYGPPLQEMSALLRKLIESVELKEEPVLKAGIKVEFIKGKNQENWKAVGKKLVFKEFLAPDSEIKVSYFVKTK